MAKKRQGSSPKNARPHREKMGEIEALKKQLEEMRALLSAQQSVPVPVIDPDEEGGLKLDLGGGDNPREGYQAVDLFSESAKFKVHLWDGQRWPWADGEVDALHSSHTIEHIDADWIDAYSVVGKIDAFMFFFTEAYRVLRPGGKFTLVWPALQNVRAFMDPTHRRFIPKESLLYLDAEWRKSQKLDHYLSRGLPLNFRVTSAGPTIPDTEAAKPDLVQQQNSNDHWNFYHDWHATLEKPSE